MKNTLTILLSTTTLFSAAQIATLEIQNPAPRISDGVEVSVSFDKKKIEKKEYPMSILEFSEGFENNLGGCDINFRTELLDTGLVTIGPFIFRINKTHFTTDSVTIRVFPDLPEVYDGVWLRLVSFSGQDILILEQKVSHHWNKNREHASSWSNDAEGVDFTSLDIDKLYALGIELKELGSSTSSSGVNDNLLGLGTLSYKLTRYNRITIYTVTLSAPSLYHSNPPRCYATIPLLFQPAPVQQDYCECMLIVALTCR